MRDVVASLIIGQLVSVSLAVGNFTTSLLTANGVDTPITQVTLSYFCVAAIYGTAQLHRRERLHLPWHWYLLLAIVESQGTFLFTKAYQYSSITSITLLDCFTIPWVVILTWYFIGTRYTLWQLIGAVICVVGLGLVFLSDAKSSSGGGSRPLLGDIIVLAATVLYALSNVGQEYCVKRRDWIEMLSMLGLFGFLVSAIELSAMEVKTLGQVEWSWKTVLCLCGYAFSNFTFHSLTPFVLKMSGSTMFNLSLLTSDLWAVVIRIFFYNQKVDWLYFLAFGVVAGGLAMYSSTGKDAESLSLDDESCRLIAVE